MANVYERIHNNVNAGMALLKEHEDLIEMAKDAGESVAQHVDKVTPIKSKMFKWAAALEKRGMPVNYNGISQ